MRISEVTRRGRVGGTMNNSRDQPVMSRKLGWRPSSRHSLALLGGPLLLRMLPASRFSGMAVGACGSQRAPPRVAMLIPCVFQGGDPQLPGSLSTAGTGVNDNRLRPIFRPAIDADQSRPETKWHRVRPLDTLTPSSRRRSTLESDSHEQGQAAHGPQLAVAAPAAAARNPTTDTNAYTLHTKLHAA